MPKDDMRLARTRFLFLQLLMLGACLLILTPVVLGEPNRFDEGFVVTGAMMIRRGWMPIRDFFVIYGAAQYYAVAAVFDVFGESLTVSRALHGVTLSLLGMAVAARTVTTSRAHIGWVAVTAIAYLAIVSVIKLTPLYSAIAAALFLLWSVRSFERWYTNGSALQLATASALAGCAGLFRWDFGIFGLLACGAAQLAVMFGRRAAKPQAARDLALVFVPGVLVMLCGFGSFVLMGDWQRWVEEVAKYALFEFNKWRGTSFIGPLIARFADGWHASNYRDMVSPAIQLALAALPFVLVGATLLRAGRKVLRGIGCNGQDAAALLIALLALGLLNQMRVRPGLNQEFAAIAVSLPLAAYLLRRRGEGAQPMGAAKSALLAIVALATCTVMAYKNWTSASREGFAVPLPKSAHLWVPALQREAWVDYLELLEYVRANSAADEPIFSGVTDTSRLFVNDAMLYFLADRPAATRWIEMEPGMTNTVAGQREVIAELERTGVRMVVLLTMTSNEPNATGRSNGVTLLDTFIRANFKVTRRFGVYEVLTRPRPQVLAKSAN
jgi:hypothetical protein